MGNTASDPQIKLINSLKEKFDPNDAASAEALEALELGRTLWRAGAFDKSAASAVIDALKAAPKMAPQRAAEPPEGMHQFGGVVFKVQRAVHGSGNLYAKALDQSADGEWLFEYAPGAIKNLSEGTLMTLDQAKEFGTTYGTCVSCGRTLTNEESIKAGIGPICSGKWF